MTHLPVPDSRTFNVRCVACRVSFSSKEASVPIECPRCQTKQPFPIVWVDEETARCVLCDCLVGSSPGLLPDTCPNGHGKTHWCGHQLLSEDQTHYCDYLSLRSLLSLDLPFADSDKKRNPGHHDEFLFVATHQIFELLFAQHVKELRQACKQMRARDLQVIITLWRIVEITRMYVPLMLLLKTMPPEHFRQFRDLLQPASGLESEGFRLVEILSGMRPTSPFLEMSVGGVSRELFFRESVDTAPSPQHLKTRLWTPRMTQVVEEDNLNSAFEDLSDDRGAVPSKEEIALILRVYEESFRNFRQTHIEVVRYQFGVLSQGAPESEKGTGGKGLQFLQSTLQRARFFPSLV